MTTDIDLAMNAAQSENKSVVIFFDQASCVYCDMLKSNVLSNSDVQKQLNENYVFLLVDINENPKFADKYRVYGTPIIKFIEPSGKVTHEIQGYVEADEFLKELKEI
jgi:thioredoxin-related protein